jgi:hypothetical protein
VANAALGPPRFGHMHKLSRLLALCSAILGLALFLYVINQTGLAEIAVRVRALGAGFLLILAISATRHLARSLAWLRCMPPAERGVGVGNLLRARLAGEALGDLTFGPVVAEPLRLVALGDKLALQAGLSSLAVENLAYTVSSCLIVVAGATALLANFAVSDSLRGAVLTALALVIALGGASVLAISRRWKLGSATLTSLADLLIRAQPRRAWVEDKLAELRKLEDYAFDFYAKRPKDFLLVGLCEAFFHLGGVLEIYATMQLIGYDLTLVTAFLLEAINRAINIAFIFVPALVGVDEAGTAVVTEVLGYGRPAGVTLAIIRKLRMFCWIGIGLVLLAASRRRR